ncbi:SsgA family sporulation/cell division regulator [Streptomyces sp. HUAS MG47]|uniref:SsgA family sporulation/cell division regulator n=1 Tax=Streptomyces solicamelliae TaxID=3231716 RepID=UPI003877E2CF
MQNTENSENTVVERELELRLVLSPERSVPVPARLTYRTDDPFAVHITFHVGSEHPVNWTFARELLVEGVFRPCGHGDVRIWPTKVDRRSVVLMALSSPDGDALLEAPSAQVSAWLERTLRAVPPGTEADRLGLDDGLARLLAPSPKLSTSLEQGGTPLGDDLWLRDPWPSDESQDGEL